MSGKHYGDLFCPTWLISFNC